MKRPVETLRTFARFSALLIATLAGATHSFATDTFSFIELNTWGVPFAAPKTWRYKMAMETIKQLSPDFVALEEVFTIRAKHAFKDKEIYPYHVDGPHFFPRLVGSGLRILSKHPIERKATLVYRNCQKDDCLSRKGALLAVVRLPSGQKLNLAVTHLNARGEDTTRQDQVNQLKTFLKFYIEPGAPLLLVGDFNFGPASALYSSLKSDLGLTDAWTATHPNGEPGYTADYTTNHYAREYAAAHGLQQTQDRINLLLNHGLKSLTSELIFNTGELISDHYGLKASFEVPAPAEASK
jgi:endonuclease/exonuclease/phosphatase family metal-dependent hydrolase